MTLYGFRPFKQPQDESDLEYVLGKNSEVFTAYDPVMIVGGVLAVATAGSKIEGVCVKTQTMSSTNQTVALVKVGYVPFRHGQQFLATSDAAVDQSIIGTYMDITGTTGAVLINGPTGSSASGQVIIKALDPLATGSTVQVLVEIAEPQDLAFAQA